MRLNYPIVYALMPISEQVGWYHGLNELEREYADVCYIVSKAYLISEKVIYAGYGERKNVYEVVFPYGQYKFEWRYQEPSCNFNNVCVNSTYVDAIFDSYQLALEYKSEINQKVLEKIWQNNSFSSLADMDECEIEFTEKLNKYELLEKQILANMSYLDNKNNKVLDYMIMSNGRFLRLNLYEFISVFSGSKYLVNSITREQYDLASSKLLSEKRLKSWSVSPILLSDGNISRVINNKKKGCYYFDNVIDGLKYSKVISSVKSEELADLGTDTIIIYTTETANDIIESYKNLDSIKLLDLENNKCLVKSKK